MAGKHVQTYLSDSEYKALTLLKLESDKSIDQLLKEAVTLLLIQEGKAPTEE
jgi:hypothetical protein